MTLLEIYEDIKNNLRKSGFNELADKITQAQIELGTPGEIFDKVCHLANEIKEHNQKAYRCSWKEIDWIVSEAKRINYLR